MSRHPACYHEYAPGIALDMGTITADDRRTVLDGQSYDTIQITDTNPIDDESAFTDEEKRNAFGVGEVKNLGRRSAHGAEERTFRRMPSTIGVLPPG